MHLGEGAIHIGFKFFPGDGAFDDLAAMHGLIRPTDHESWCCSNPIQLGFGRVDVHCLFDAFVLAASLKFVFLDPGGCGNGQGALASQAVLLVKKGLIGLPVFPVFVGAAGCCGC